MRKILYVDTPFQGIRGGDKNRSQYLWELLSSQYDADLLLLKTGDYLTRPLPVHSGYRKSFSLSTQPAAFYQAKAIHRFHRTQIQKFEKVLLSEQYELIVFRFLSCFELTEIAGELLPKAVIAIDVDMLFSRISELVWKRDPGIHNRYHLLEMLKLKAFEKKAFEYDYLFFFTNPLELRMAVQERGLAEENALLCPNVMPSSDQERAETKPENRILFFGSLGSVANRDAFEYLAQEIYPLVEAELETAGVRISIAGKAGEQLSTEGCPHLELLGEVEDMASVIAASRFVVLPLRIASGTRTRILEAAAAGKAVITSSLGLEGLELSSVLIADEAHAFADCIKDLLHEEARAIELGNALHQEACRLYSPKLVGEAFLSALEQGNTGFTAADAEPVQPDRSRGGALSIALVTNRFYPEVGGAETNIYYQARKLSERHRVTVFCPRRQEDQNSGRVDNFMVKRLPDLLNIPPQYPNLAAKTLCPTLLWELLRGDFDVIQCFPALNYNNMLAFLAAKLRRKPIILCFFDFVDYAALIKSEGKVRQNYLLGLQLPWHQKFILKRLDSIFAIAQKELDFIKRFNHRVAYSPVPVLTEEYGQALPDPRPALGFEQEDFVYLCLGRISQIKGQDIALRAFAQVAHKLPGAKLVFVGRTDYEPNFYAGLLALVADHNLQDKVFFTGMLERKEVLAWLNYADLHVIPVRFMNSGAVVVESWISGTAVLQSDVVDPNLVEEGQNGYLFRSEDYLDCATKMKLAYQRREELSRLAASGKELVLKKYTYDYLCSLYEAAYLKLLEDKRS